VNGRNTDEEHVNNSADPPPEKPSEDVISTNDTETISANQN
jgi:hypothetical protein